MTYVREAGEGAEVVSVALAQTQYFLEVRIAQATLLCERQIAP